jgi:hypothetical protein
MDGFAPTGGRGKKVLTESEPHRNVFLTDTRRERFQTVPYFGETDLWIQFNSQLLCPYFTKKKIFVT